MIRYRDIIEKKAYSAEQLKSDVGLGGVSDKEILGTAAGAALGGVGGSYIPYLWTKDPGRGARLLTAVGGALGGGLITNSLMDKERLRNEQYGSVLGDAWRNKWSALPYAAGAGAYAGLSAGANDVVARSGAVRLAGKALASPAVAANPAVMTQLQDAKRLLLSSTFNTQAAVTTKAQNEALSTILNLTHKTPEMARLRGSQFIAGIPGTKTETAARLLYKFNHMPQSAKAWILKFLRKGR